MENASYIALSRQVALRRQMETVANNIANMNTPGFKAQRMLFVEHLVEPEGLGTSGQPAFAMVRDQAVVRDLANGALEKTDNPLDVALQDDSYMVVETSGGPRYTRNGRLQIDTESRIVDGNGLPVLNTADAPITVPLGSRDIVIAEDGTISTENGSAGQLKLVRFDRPTEMTPLGGGLLVTNELPKEVENPIVAQGMLESSNVQPVIEMTHMIDVARSYQSAQNLIQSDHELQRTAIQRLGRLQSS